MLLQEPPPTPYDMRFMVMGFPVRISWSFWLGAIVIGMNLVQGLDASFGKATPGMLPLLILWGLSLLVSILIHELGHALAFRQNGLESSIVLYHFGGLAIPRGSVSSGAYGGLTPKQSMWISFAGPLAQLASAVLLLLIVKGAGYRVDNIIPSFLEWIPGTEGGATISSPGLFALLLFYIYPGIFWAFLNLIPVYPLDGGQITKSIVDLCGGTMIQTLWISVIAAALMVGYTFSIGQQMLGLFFLVFGVTNYQTIQHLGRSYY